jgi:predicted metal-binding membrane protein
VKAVNKAQQIITSSLLVLSAASWLASQVFQTGMTAAMGRYDSISVLFFVAIWTVGMAAMMFPAITPMVLLYNRMANSSASQATSLENAPRPYHFRTVLFVGCYLVVWSLTGLALFLGWSAIMNWAMAGLELHYLYGAVLMVAGIYQFSSLKTKCLGYCESPLSFFMRRWKGGTAGAIRMGVYHGLYCLGCCWPYFLLMVALGWMNLLWMALFAAIIFGEKIWSKGIWIARIAGVGLLLAGVLVVAQVIPFNAVVDNAGMIMEDTITSMS